jgi:hypothetical protein
MLVAVSRARGEPSLSHRSRSVKGFLERSKLPSGLFVASTPANDPNSPLNRSEHLAFMGEKAVLFGFEVTEKPDGTVEMK